MDNSKFSNFVISVRNVRRRRETARFGSEPGKTLYLEVPDGETPHPIDHQQDRNRWVNAVIDRASSGRRHPTHAKNPLSGYTIGDVLVFVHGYNNSINDVMNRHNLLQRRLQAHGYLGVIVSYDWPSAESALNYLEDRSDAKTTAHRLVEDGIKVLAFAQRNQDENKCDIDVHLLGHSTGAYVIREAFYEASHSRQISRINWTVSQIAFIGGDIARTSMSSNDGKSRALFDHARRITNYQNPFDSALKLSNVKRLGISPRIGRVGLPNDAPDSVVNVNVGQHWKALQQPADNSSNWSHSWHFDDDTFASDLAETLIGDIDRSAIRTRVQREGSLWLVGPDTDNS